MALELDCASLRTYLPELERFSDKYRQSPASQPTLRRVDLHAPFFPQEIFEGYFNPRKKRKSVLLYCAS
ncbi:hypothetical protein M404DRAFT_992342 [Pisolithus tinctorius Marx 270]|uniref:Uncharacterized protein n=1 Tax=Pisolithus tinctorius Marx 270 TaxID=870435 RepID=A0A0C3JY71_PISTI|nr:hypothetical protein M404DRAFT_992342 [Pisolithus tinctorius Marx 270]